MADDVQCSRLVWLPANGAAQGPLLTTVYAVAGVDFLGIAIAIQIDTREASGSLLAQWDIDRALDLAVIIVAKLGFDMRTELTHHRASSFQVDHSAGRIASEQRALGAAQYFYLLYIVVFGFENAWRVQIHIIDVHRNTRVRARCNQRVADAADLEVIPRKVAPAVGHVGHD